METATATRLADLLEQQRGQICARVSARLIQAYPELTGMLRLEEDYVPEARLAEVSVERFNELVRAMLVFELPSLAEQELRWAHGVLPRKGVSYEHQSSMVRWYFEEVRRLDLTPPEIGVMRDLERYLLEIVGSVYQKKG